MTPRVRRRTSRCWWRRQPEAGETAAARTTLSTMAREETSGKTREENPGTAKGGRLCWDHLASTDREDMTPDELAESALVIQWQLAHEARETAAVMTTSSSVAREETSGKAREETPGADREADDVRITSLSTTREEITPD